MQKYQKQTVLPGCVGRPLEEIGGYDPKPFAKKVLKRTQRLFCLCTHRITRMAPEKRMDAGVFFETLNVEESHHTGLYSSITQEEFLPYLNVVQPRLSVEKTTFQAVNPLLKRLNLLL